MTPIQMVEHLAWAAEVSIGAVSVPCKVPPGGLESFRPFLYNDAPTSREFMNPILKNGLPRIEPKPYQKRPLCFSPQISASSGRAPMRKRSCGFTLYLAR